VTVAEDDVEEQRYPVALITFTAEQATKVAAALILAAATAASYRERIQAAVTVLSEREVCPQCRYDGIRCTRHEVSEPR
jgi:hypothetical protein